MSIFSALMGGQMARSIEEVWNTKDVTSFEMREAINQWFALYYDAQQPETIDSCQRIPFTIVNKLTKTVFSEYTCTVTNKSEFIERLLDKLQKLQREALQLVLVGGECFVKPVIYRNEMDFVLIRRDCFVPFGRDAKGRIVSVGTMETTQKDGKYYTLLERRSVDGEGRLTVENRLYQSHDRLTLGTMVSLSALRQYEMLQPMATLPIPLWNVGMTSLKTPMLNMVDGSHDGVSVYAPAVKLLQNINRNEKLLNDEFENGRSRIIASSDMLDSDTRGRKRFEDTLFVAVDDNPENVGVTVYSPTLRETSYLSRKQEYLRNIESLIGLKRGILSEVEATERTATEITSSAGDYNLTIQDFQQSWVEMLGELIPTCLILGEMYSLCPHTTFDSSKDITVDWGDGVLFNRDKVWQEYQSMVASGLLKPELALAWYFNLPHSTPQEIEQIRQQYMPEIDRMLGGED